MKYFLISFVVAVCSANMIKDPLLDYNVDDRYFYFAGDDDDTIQLIDAMEPVDVEFINNYMEADSNGYWLFTRSNRVSPEILKYGDNNSISRSHFNKQRNTIFLAHGWMGNGASEINTLLSAAFLQDHEVNVIVLDWSELAARNYLTAKRGLVEVGRKLGQFINWLVTVGASYERIHLVGFSLGGHLVGNAGRETGGKVQRITALDPAGPLWLIDNDRLKKSDGQYVEVIHTNTALLGFTEPCGDADFYPNGGASMTGCYSNTCSHSRSYEYMAASLRHNDFLASECGSRWNARRGRCSGGQVLMGNSDLSPKPSGVYRVNTDNSYPV